ncbi:hypothetical protein V6N11_007260 [Hibiscus sabdariffa]|uniref:Uncharacterized protein n=1 Tax=Hibiscus sabdariffa TaxID=183260 RepID=A0ABR2RT77_9ROSI
MNRVVLHIMLLTPKSNDDTCGARVGMESEEIMGCISMCYHQHYPLESKALTCIWVVLQNLGFQVLDPLLCPKS